VPAADRPLTVPLLVRGSFETFPLIVLSVCCLTFAGIAAFAWSKEPPRNHSGSAAFLAIAALCGLPALVIATRAYAHRRWLEVTLTGFILTRRGQRTVIGDEEIVAVRHRSRSDSQGVTHYSLRIDIDREGSRQTVDCRYPVPALHTDPLGVFLDRIVRGLARRTRDGLGRGTALSGKGWRIACRPATAERMQTAISTSGIFHPLKPRPAPFCRIAVSSRPP
jgi:hypothetical protein